MLEWKPQQETGLRVSLSKYIGSPAEKNVLNIQQKFDTTHFARFCNLLDVGV